MWYIFVHKHICSPNAFNIIYVSNRIFADLDEQEYAKYYALRLCRYSQRYGSSDIWIVVLYEYFVVDLLDDAKHRRIFFVLVVDASNTPYNI